MDVRLRPYREHDRDSAIAAHEVLALDDFPFLLGWSPSTPWSNFLAELDEHRRGVGVPEHWVRGTQLCADVDGEIIGRASIRFELNDYLLERGGHIGYCVLPAWRRRGYATEILRQALVVARSEGVTRVLVTCDDDNEGSARAIERCGGVLESIVPGESTSNTRATQPGVRRYWID
ncbi:MAG TPA: GNAT family N-acetyltransferase [Acidimicrobiales bacterium]|nr:GNAT family N-acetyltransferase [Acidimicrobiales bacterium]